MAIKMPQFNNVDLSINEQREVGRRYSSWVKMSSSKRYYNQP